MILGYNQLNPISTVSLNLPKISILTLEKF